MKTALADSIPTVSRNPLHERRAVGRLVAQLDQLADNSDHLIKKPFGQIESNGQKYQLPRYLYLGPTGGGDVIRIGIFATIHGDEPEGALAITRLVAALEKNPEIAKGYCLFLYPVCNPTGFEDNTRHSRRGRDLNRKRIFRRDGFALRRRSCRRGISLTGWRWSAVLARRRAWRRTQRP